MSILENIASVAETPSPSSHATQPRSRLRSAARVSSRFQDGMRRMDEEGAGRFREDTDESSPPTQRRSRGRPPRKQQYPTKAASRRDSVESVEDEEEDDEEDGGQQEEEEDEGGSSSRYTFRERRGTVKKPTRFDEAMYDQVFRPLQGFNDSRSTRKSRERGRRGGASTASRESERRSSSSRSKRVSQPTRGRPKRRRLNDEEEEDEEDEDEERDELDYATDESDIGEIQRRINEQEQAEAAEAAAAIAAVEALEEGGLPLMRKTRSTRYSLRGKEEEDAGGSLSLSPERRTRSSNRVKQEQRDDDEENDNDDGQDDEDEDEDGEEEEEEVVEQEDEPRYSLRRRRHSDEAPPRARSSSTRHQLRRGASNASSTSVNPSYVRNNRERDRRRERRAQQLAAPEEEEEPFASQELNGGPRYSLRDRSKVQRMGDAEVLSKHNAAVYAEYAKQRRGRNSNNNNASSRSGRRRRGGHRTRRLSGSSSSSSSSDDMYKYYESDQGGMRSSSATGKRGKGGHHSESKSRADISPIEVDRSITWDSVGGLEKHIEALKEMVMLPLLYPEFYAKYHVAPPSGVLFYGPPGTGKTLLARALANSCSVDGDSTSPDQPAKPRHVTFYMRKGADCLSKWVGEAERQLRLLFDEAKRNEPSIIFFDEIDGLAPVRSAKQDQIHASIVSTLLALMDGLDARGRVVVIGATNRLDAIDPALRRPGRFDRELGFKLPNVRERKKMLGIHTKHWSPPLQDAFLQDLATRTVGYCGADVKALCAEAALCSLRRVYPQVYGSQDKLLIQLDRVVVSRGDFHRALAKITPASHRTVSSFAAPLPRGVSLLLDGDVHAILKRIASRFPQFPIEVEGHETGKEEEDDDDDDLDVDIYAVVNRDDCDVCHGDDGELLCCDACPGAFHAACLAPDLALQADEWFCPDCRDQDRMAAWRARRQAAHKQRVARQLYALPPQAGFPRVLVTGSGGLGPSLVGAALLHALEGLTHFSLDYPSLVADVHTHSAEEALVFRLREAQKCLPCVVYLPQADLWWETTPESMHVALQMLLLQMQAKHSLPVLFLATTTGATDELPPALRELFTAQDESAVVWTLPAISTQDRTRHFAQAFAAFAAAPLATPRHARHKRRRHDQLEVLPLAPVPKKPKRVPTLDELERLREHDLHCLRELRIFLGQVLDYCGSQRAYAPFLFPVDPVAVPDYYLIISHPMDLASMREKLNDGDYTCFEQFLDDVQRIVRNATLFNPKRSATRHIAHAAGTMKDNILSFAHRFRKHQGYDLFAKCREVTRRLHTTPAMYSQFRAEAEPTAVAREPVRASARLKGIEAPAVERDDAWTAKQKKTEQPAVEEEEQEHKAVEEGEEGAAPQWFQSPKAEDEDEDTAEEAETATDEDVANASPVFAKGDAVFVTARTHPGMNKLGGAAKVVMRNADGSYYVKYVLGGSEKAVPPVYVRAYSEEAVKQSVKNQRPDAAASPGRVTTASGASSEARQPKSEAEMASEFFYKLVWPILEEDGWTQAAGDALLFVAPAKEEGGGDPVEFDSVDAVLAFIKSHKPLAIKCFGRRYAEELVTEAVIGASVEAHAAAAVEPETVEPPVAAQAEDAGTLSTTTAAAEEAQEEKQDEDEGDEEMPEFVYDEARMSKTLDDLVACTAGWSLQQLRDELLLLNRLAYPFRFAFDRSALMDQVDAHVASLGSSRQ